MNRLFNNAAIRPFLRTIALLIGLLPGIGQAQVVALDQIVAVVDEDVVVSSELDAEMNKIIARIRQSGSPMPSKEVLEPQVLERLIMKKLSLAAAARSGVSVSEDVLAQAIGNIARNGGVTLSELRATLEREGISFRSFRESIREQIIIQQLMDKEVRQRIRVTDREIKAYLAQLGASAEGRSEYHLRHILIATPEGASPEQLRQARDKAEILVQKLRQGLDFSTAALTESDSQQALSGGDLGWRPTGQLPTLFADQVGGMEQGEISDPIHSPSGYHIIMVEDYKGGERHVINQTHVRHILVKTNEVTSDEDAITRLEQLKQRIDGGDDFADLARSHSDDTGSAIEGGDLGWVTPGDLLPLFEEKMNQLAIDQVSTPFNTDFSWHIVQVLGRREHDSTQEVQKAEARDEIRERKFEEESELYLRRLRDEAYVITRLTTEKDDE